MKVKDINLKKIEELKNNTDGELYVVNISFQGSEPVLNLYKPYDDSDIRAEKRRILLDEYQSFVLQMDEYFKQHPEL